MLVTRTAIALTLALPALAQQEVTLVPVKDNTLYQNFNGIFSNALGPNFFVGRNSEDRARRGLLQFDVTGNVPAGSTILDVRLELECTAVPQNVVPTAQSLHRALASWGEGTSTAFGPGGTGGGATPGDATWRHRFSPDVEWDTRGGDFDDTPLATTVVDAEGPVTFTGAALVPLVQDWLEHPITNHGFLVKDDLELIQSARRYASRENDEPGFVPRLVIEFEGPAIGVPYCSPAVLNSTGAPGYAWASGSDVVADNDLTLHVTSLPVTSFGYVLASQTQDMVPMGMGSDGVFCLGGQVAGFRTQTRRTGAQGDFAVPVDLTSFPLATGVVAVQAGETWHFQAWYRDADPDSTSNFTDAVSVTFR